MTGYDAGKKVKGRQRHLVVEPLGLLLALSVISASIQDRDAAPVVAQAMAKVSGLRKLYTDSAYGGSPGTNARRLIAHHDRSAAPVAWVWLVEARILATRLAG